MKTFRYADQVHRASGAADDDGHRKFARACNFEDAGNGSLHRFHITYREFVAERLPFGACVHEFGPNEIGTDAFNLGDDEFAAGEGDGDDKNDGSAADDDAQRRKDRAQFIAAQRVDRDGESFAQVHHDAASFLRRFNASRAVLSLGSNFRAVSYS